MRKYSLFLLCGSLLLASCGGGLMSGFPNAVLSATALTFGNQVIGTTSQPLTITLTNSGTAALSITSMAASPNFEQNNNCGSTLASGTNCTITVSFAPSVTGQLNGTVSINDNASGSPQMVSLSGTGTTSGTGGSCSVQGQECGAEQLPPCCSGLTCIPASTRAFCQP